MGEKEEITLSLNLIHNLIMCVQPGEFSQAVLRLQGLGTISGEFWIWDRERVHSLDGQELIKLINELLWK